MQIVLQNDLLIIRRFEATMNKVAQEEGAQRDADYAKLDALTKESDACSCRRSSCFKGSCSVIVSSQESSSVGDFD